MARVLILLAEGFEEIEALTAVSLLHKAGVHVVTAGLAPGQVKGSADTVVLPSTHIDEVVDQDFDMLIIPGGSGVMQLNQDQRVRRLVERHHADNRWLAAICAGPLVLASAGILDGKSITAYPGLLKAADYPNVNIVDVPVLVDGRVLTSRSPGTAVDFALQMIEVLVGKTERDQLDQGLARYG
jgi:4-methyl-5(b-hydroxyethyl)-thiazole monophosphate biosynthesis